LVKRWLDDALRVETENKIELNHWHHVAVTYDGSRSADGARIYIDGEPQKLKVLLDELNQSFNVKEPLRIGAGGGPENRFHGHIDDARVYKVALIPEDVAVIADSASVGEIARIAPENRTPAQARKIADCFVESKAPQHIQLAWRQLSDLRQRRAQLLESLPTVMVMQALTTGRVRRSRPACRSFFHLCRLAKKIIGWGSHAG
jgi:hypothetical protein